MKLQIGKWLKKTYLVIMCESSDFFLLEKYCSYPLYHYTASTTSSIRNGAILIWLHPDGDYTLRDSCQ